MADSGILFPLILGVTMQQIFVNLVKSGKSLVNLGKSGKSLVNLGKSSSKSR